MACIVVSYSFAVFKMIVFGSITVTIPLLTVKLLYHTVNGRCVTADASNVTTLVVEVQKLTISVYFIIKIKSLYFINAFESNI